MNDNIQDMANSLGNWLSHPNELGYFPQEIIHTNHFVDNDGINCDVFKYKEINSGIWLLGIVSEAGCFSEMKEYNANNEINDAQELLNVIKNYWKQMAQQFDEPN